MAAMAAASVGVKTPKIVLDSDIKAFGSYTVQVKLHPGVTADVYVVVGEND